MANYVATKHDAFNVLPEHGQNGRLRDDNAPRKYRTYHKELLREFALLAISEAHRWKLHDV